MFDHLDNAELRAEINRLSAIEPTNTFHGINGGSVGDAVAAMEEELARRCQNYGPTFHGEREWNARRDQLTDKGMIEFMP